MLNHDICEVVTGAILSYFSAYKVTCRGNVKFVYILSMCVHGSPDNKFKDLLNQAQ